MIGASIHSFIHSSDDDAGKEPSFHSFHSFCILIFITSSHLTRAYSIDRSRDLINSDAFAFAPGRKRRIEKNLPFITMMRASSTSSSHVDSPRRREPTIAETDDRDIDRDPNER